MTRAEELKQAWPKGTLPPYSYVAWHEWARAQAAHGLKQKKCRHCGLYKFPQEVHCTGSRAAQRR